MTEVKVLHQLEDPFCVDEIELFTEEGRFLTTIVFDSPVSEHYKNFILNPDNLNEEQLREINKVHIETSLWYERSDVRGFPRTSITMGKNEHLELPMTPLDGDLTFSHLDALEFIYSNIPGIEISGNHTTWHKGRAIDISRNGDGANLESKVRIQRLYFPQGLGIEGENFFDFKVKSTITPDGKLETSYLTMDGKLIPLEFGFYPGVKQLADLHNSAIKNIWSELQSQYQDVHGKKHSWRNEELYQWEFYKLTQVDYWDSRQKEMTKIANYIGKAIQESHLSKYIKEIVLIGSLAKKDKMPDDIDLVIIVDDPDKKVLDPEIYTTKERRNSLNERVKKYGNNDVTDGLVEELGIFEVLQDYAMATSTPSIRQDEEIYDVPHTMIFGDHGVNFDLNAVYISDLRNFQSMVMIMKSRSTPAYHRDILNDGLLLNPDGKQMISAKEKYGNELSMLQDILKIAIKEGWQNHVEDKRYNGD